MSNLIIVKVSVCEDIYLLMDSNNYLPAKYVSKFEDKSLSDLEIEYLYNCLRDNSIKWSHLFTTQEALENDELILA